MGENPSYHLSKETLEIEEEQKEFLDYLAEKVLIDPAVGKIERSIWALLQESIPPSDLILSTDIPSPLLETTKATLDFALANGCAVDINVRDTDHAHIMVSAEDSKAYLEKKSSILISRSKRPSKPVEDNCEEEVLSFLLERARAIFIHTQDFFDYRMPPNEYEKITGVKRERRNIYCEIGGKPQIAEVSEEERENGLMHVHPIIFCQRSGIDYFDRDSFRFRRSKDGQIVLENGVKVLIFVLKDPFLQ